MIATKRGVRDVSVVQTKPIAPFKRERSVSWDDTPAADVDEIGSKADVASYLCRGFDVLYTYIHNLSLSLSLLADASTLRGGTASPDQAKSNHQFGQTNTAGLLRTCINTGPWVVYSPRAASQVRGANTRHPERSTWSKALALLPWPCPGLPCTGQDQTASAAPPSFPPARTAAAHHHQLDNRRHHDLPTPSSRNDSLRAHSPERTAGSTGLPRLLDRCRAGTRSIRLRLPGHITHEHRHQCSQSVKSCCRMHNPHCISFLLAPLPRLYRSCIRYFSV